MHSIVLPALPLCAECIREGDLLWGWLVTISHLLLRGLEMSLQVAEHLSVKRGHVVTVTGQGEMAIN